MGVFFDHIISDGQNLYDVSIQRYGSVAALFTLMEDNPELIPNINAKFKPGDVLKIRTEFTELDDVDQENQRLFRTKDIKVNTGQVDLEGDYNPDFNDDFFN